MRSGPLRSPSCGKPLPGFNPTDDYREFIAQSWVEEYGVFQALKRANGGVCWNEWKEADKAWPEKRSPLSAARGGRGGLSDVPSVPVLPPVDEGAGEGP